MSDAPVHLIPWLKYHLQRDGTAGLKWYDVDQRIFLMYWPDGRKEKWSDDDFPLCKLWKEHKRRFLCVEQSHPSGTHRDTFRSALNNRLKKGLLKEFKRGRRSDIPDHFRVLQFCDTDDERPSIFLQNNDVNGMLVQTGSSGIPALETLDGMLVPIGSSGIPALETLLSDEDSRGQWNNFDALDVTASQQEDVYMQIRGDSGGIEDQSETESNPSPDYITNTCNYSCEQNITTHQQYPSTGGDSGSNFLSNTGVSTELIVEVHYFGKLVTRGDLGSQGCRLYSSIIERSFFNGAPFQEDLLGPDVAQIALPNDIPQLLWKAGQRESVIQILNNMDRGILVYLKDMNIFIKRLCKSSVHLVVSGERQGGTKLGRNDEVKIFDFQDAFQNQLKAHITDRELPPPPDFVSLTIGSKMPVVTVNIFHLGASRLLNSAHYSLDESSLSNEFDKLLSNFKTAMSFHQTP